MSRSSPTTPSTDGVHVGHRGPVASVRLCRATKRNALSDKLMAAIGKSFDAMPVSTRAIVLHGEGEHFSAGLDLSEINFPAPRGEGIRRSASQLASFAVTEERRKRRGIYPP